MSQESDHKDEVEFPYSSFTILSCLFYKNIVKVIFRRVNIMPSTIAFFCTSLHLMQLLSTERANRNKDQLSLQDTVSELQKSLQSEQQAAEGSDEVLMFLLFYDHLPELLSVLSRFL